MDHARPPSADLELSLRRWGRDDYALEARFRLSASAAPAQLIAGAPPRIRTHVWRQPGRSEQMLRQS